jgi:hypothetical protein
MQRIEEMIEKLPAIHAPETLKGRILARITEAAERSARFHRALFGALSLVSAVLMLPALQFAIREFSQSAFASYFSLIFIDGTAALANWKTLILSLVESAPVVGLVCVLAAVFALLASVRAFGRYTGAPRLSHAIS